MSRPPTITRIQQHQPQPVDLSFLDDDRRFPR